MEKAKQKAKVLQRLCLLEGNLNDWLECIENSAIGAMEEDDSETRETLLETIVEVLGYVSMCTCDISKIAKGALKWGEKKDIQKTCKLELRQSNTNDCTSTQEEETKRLIMSYVNSFKDLN